MLNLLLWRQILKFFMELYQQITNIKSESPTRNFFHEGPWLRFLTSDILDRPGEEIAVLGVVNSLRLLEKIEDLFVQVAGMTFPIPVNHPEDDFEESTRFPRVVGRFNDSFGPKILFDSHVTFARVREVVDQDPLLPVLGFCEPLDFPDLCAGMSSPHGDDMDVVGETRLVFTLGRQKTHRPHPHVSVEQREHQIELRGSLDNSELYVLACHTAPPSQCVVNPMCCESYVVAGF